MKYFTLLEKMKIKPTIIFAIYITSSMLGYGMNPETIKSCIENVYHNHLKLERIYIINTLIEPDEDIWLNWRVYTVFDSMGYNDNMYDIWYVQKYDRVGKPYFPPIEIKKGDKPHIIHGGIGAATIGMGFSDDVYSFPGLYRYSFYRIDKEGNLFTVDSLIFGSMGKYFSDTKNVVYVSSSWHDQIFINKYSVGQGAPRLTKTISLPPPFDLYRWLCHGVNFNTFCWRDKKLLAIGPANTDFHILSDTTLIKVYQTYLNNFHKIDTFSFYFQDALWKKFPGCVLRQQDGYIQIMQYLFPGQGDTLLLYFGNKSWQDDTIYCCRITNQGKPIPSEKVIIENPMDFKDAPPRIPIECYILGTASNICAPSGIRIVGFDPKGSIYYYYSKITD